MRKIVVGCLLILSLVLGVVFYRMQANTDVTPPEITFPEEEALYEEGMETTILLEGVTATDNVDGDVSDSLVVESVIPLEDMRTATVIYYAKDRSNNVRKATRVVKYRAANMEDWMKDLENMVEEAEEKEASKSKETEPEETEQPSETEGETGNEAATEDETAAESETSAETSKPRTANAEAPVVKLSKTQVRIKRGDQFYPLEYIEDIEDDKDDRSHLFGQIHIDSNNVDTSVPGTYEVVFSVTDSDNHCSEQATLKVIVEE